MAFVGETTHTVWPPPPPPPAPSPTPSGVRPYVPRPKPGSLRTLTPPPEPYVHPRVLFTLADRPELLERAKGTGVLVSNDGKDGSKSGRDGVEVKGENDSAAPAAPAAAAAQQGIPVGQRSFAALSKWVERAVYHPDSPIKAALACLLDPSVWDDPQSPTGKPQRAFALLCNLVTDPDDPRKTLRGSFYTRLMAWGLAQWDSARILSPSVSQLFEPPAADATPEMAAKFLFASLCNGPSSAIYVALQNAAYVAWIDDDRDRMELLARATSMAAQVHMLWHTGPCNVLTKGTGFYAQVHRPDSSVSPHLALAYDWLYHAFPSEALRAPVRRLLLTMARNRTVNGFDAQRFRYGREGLAPYCTAGTYQIQMADVLLVHYAVEGESVGEGEGQVEGGELGGEALAWDVASQRLNERAAVYYMSYGTAFDPTGLTREAPGYFMTAMRGAAIPFVAAARRGVPIFTQTHFYNVLMDVLQPMAPWSLAPPCYGSHDGIGYCGGFAQSEYYLVVRYMYPDDPLAAFVYQKINTADDGRSIDMYGLNKMPLQAAIFGLDVEPTNVSYAQLLKRMEQAGNGSDSAADSSSCNQGRNGSAGAGGLPLAFFSNMRGVGTARSSWADEEGALLYFESRPDTFNIGHCHSNRNDFYFAALGRLWVSVGQYHNTEGEAHSMVLVDGVGQGGSHTEAAPPEYGQLWSHIPGKVVETFDSRRMTWFAGDASLAYRFVTNGVVAVRMGDARDPPAPNNPLRTTAVWRDSFLVPPQFGPLFTLEPGTKTPATVVTGDGVWVDNDDWLDSPVWGFGDGFNPVEFAFRTACLVRGGVRPYALIVDDIKAASVRGGFGGGDEEGSASHTYTWVINTTAPYRCGSNKPVRLLDPSSLGLDGRTDAILVRGEDWDEKTDKPIPGSPRLLLRVLQGEGEATGDVRLVHVEKGSGEPGKSSWSDYDRLEVERRGVVGEPMFKVLLYPFREGEEMPVTRWVTGEASEKRKLVVEWSRAPVTEAGDEARHGLRQMLQDMFVFEKDGNRTRVTLCEEEDMG